MPESPQKALASSLPSLHAVSQEQHTAESAPLLWGGRKHRFGEVTRGQHSEGTAGRNLQP